MPRLVIEKGRDKGSVLVVQSQGTLFVGRDPSSSLQLRDPMASRMHFKLECDENGIRLNDLESLNGTLVNGGSVRETQLKGGDLIQVGETLLSFMADDAPEDALIGQRIGGYKLLDRVGRGGMGTVFKAEQVDLQRIVALKLISEEHTKNKEFVDMFIHEARAAAKLNHPHIVQVYDVKRFGDKYYFSMEYVSGGSVQDIVNKQRTIPVDETVRMILEAARGLDYAHKKGIIHRDVKPDNLMLSETGMVKIGDLGLARGLEEKVGPAEETSVIGTPHYIAPEQVLGKPADFRSDIYSLGGTAYRMLSGVTPFTAHGVRELVKKKIREDPAPLQELNPPPPKRVCEIVSRMMARDPDRRYQSMAEVVTDLERYQLQSMGPFPEDRPAESLLSGSRKVWLAVILAVMIGGGIAAAFFLLSPNGTPVKKKGTVIEDASLALQMLENADLMRLKEMDRGDPASIKKVIDRYEKVIERFPGTTYAERAAGSRDELQRELRELAARKELKELEKADVEAYGRVIQAFQAQRHELSPVKEAAGAYRAFAESGEGKGTKAGEEALARADHIEKWMGLVEKQREEFERIVSEAEQFAGLDEYKSAWSLLRAYHARVREAELKSGFAQDRYRSLLYDRACGREEEKIVARAQEHWAGVRQEAAALAAENRYEDALQVLAPVLEHSLEDILPAARSVKEQLEVEWAAMKRRKEEAEKKAHEAAVARAMAAYEASAREARGLILNYDFQGAVTAIRELRDSGAIEEIRARIERRILELERAASFMKILVGAINNKKSSGFKPDYVKGALEGAIGDADLDHFQLKVGMGGSVQLQWSGFEPSDFYRFVKTQWKYNEQQDGEVVHKCNLASLCMEFGLYEEALAEIDGVMKAPEYKTSETVWRFCDEYRLMIGNGQYTEHDEIEAEKRLIRMRRLLGAGERRATRTEIQVIRREYGETRACKEKEEEIEAAWKKAGGKGSSGSGKTSGGVRFKRIQDHVVMIQEKAKAAQADILKRINRFGDPFEKYVSLGDVYAAAGRWRDSNEKYGEARKLGEGMITRGEAGREFLPKFAGVYDRLYRNYVVLGLDRMAAAVRTHGDKVFVNATTNEPEMWWTRAVRWNTYWSEQVYPVHKKSIQRLQSEMASAPKDPLAVWKVAQCLWDGLRDGFQARGYFSYLLEYHPDFPQVTNGTCKIKLAEILFEAHEIPAALKLYEEVAEKNPEHSKVRNPLAWGSVRRRIKQCSELAEKMGYLGENK